MEGKEKEHKSKNRLKGLFAKKVGPSIDPVDDSIIGLSDKLHFLTRSPTATSSQEIDEFLHGPPSKPSSVAAKPTSTHPPRLTRIDTNSASRWPTAAEVRSSTRSRGRSASPKRSKKGLVVRFTDAQPVVIGEGGDEAELPTIALRQRAHTHPPSRPTSRDSQLQNAAVPPPSKGIAVEEIRDMGVFQPGPLRRAATGFQSIPDTQIAPSQQPLTLGQEKLDAAQNSPTKNESHDPRSFAARVRADRRSGEGLALLHSASNPFEAIDEPPLSDESPEAPPINSGPPIDNLSHIKTAGNNENRVSEEVLKPLNPLTKLELPNYSPVDFGGISGGATSTGTVQNTLASHPPPSDTQQLDPTASIPSQLYPGSRPSSEGRQESHSELTNEMAISRTSTLNLHGAAIAVGTQAIEEFSARVAHLFNIFLLSAESKAPVSKCSLEDFVRAALWWFLKGRLHLESMIRDRPTTPEAHQSNFLVRQQAYAELAKSLWILQIIAPQYPEVSSKQTDPHVIDILETRDAILSSLKKLTMSMKRNNFLPPEEATLPQGLDTSIWVQDDGNRSVLASHKQAVLPNLNDYLPLGDTNRSFHYGRAFAGASLIKAIDSQSQEYRTPVLISIIRGHSQTVLTAVIASQDGMLKTSVQADKSLGPTWDAVTWNSVSNILDIKLPEGLLLRVQCNHHDFRTLRSIYDYQKKTHSSMVRQQDEELVFETFLNTFQYFNQDPTSTFPKEPLISCRLRLFEKSLVHKAASGSRRVHRGFRIALVTSPRTKNLRGINQDISPILPIQFDFLRNDGGLPTLLLRLPSQKFRCTVAFTFEDVNERTELHTQFTGISLGDREGIVMESELMAFSVSALDQPIDNILKPLAWQSMRVVNENQEDIAKTVLSAHLRVVTDFNSGSITDRFNVEPGELKIHLDVNNLNEFKVLRQPQQDMTISISESQIPKGLPDELEELLATIATSETTRTYMFPSLPKLHLFQAALTGCTVLFDGVASSMNISRRRMVVPIYKKWEAAKTRLQLVEREKVIQIVMFFENFSHGECMNFALKSTDVFETSGRHAKLSLRIVDAKFAMPKAREARADASFVCLDVLEYPGEHDDITIVFENESDYESFIKVLPGPVKTASRIPSVRK